MAERDDHVNIIPKNEYKEDLEAEVKLHVARIEAMGVFRVNKKYSHIVIPKFKLTERREKLEWVAEEIRRCEQGYDGLPGRYYYFLNHVHIREKDKGKIRPTFRAKQLEWAKTKERIWITPGVGIVMIKRRQCGLSWDMAVDNIYDCQFNHEFEIGMNSKTELDSHKFFDKHKYVHRNQTSQLKSFIHIDKRNAMVFHKWMKNENRYKGTGSSIYSVAPTPTGHAGNQYKKLVCDESGEVDILSIWANAEDCITQDTVRVGKPFIFGTVGDAGSVGQGIIEMYKNAEAYNLERFAFWGYNCLLVDELGNDMIEEAVRWIIYTRKKKEAGSGLVLKKFYQKYPLTEEDAFLDATGSGVGDPLLIGRQRLHLIDNPPFKMVGYLRPGTSIRGVADFVPDELNGKVTIYELPDSNRVDGYLATCDPAEDDDVEKSRDTSELSTTILAKPYGPEPPKLVLEYSDRPKKLHVYYQQLALILEAWGIKLNIELNKGGWRMVDWFELNYPHLLAFAPASFNSLKGGVKLARGVKMTPERIVQMKGLGDAYVENYVQFIPSIKLLDQLKVCWAKGKDDDEAISFLWNLVLLQGDKTMVRNANEVSVKVPTVNYVKENGVIRLKSQGNTPGTLSGFDLSQSNVLSGPEQQFVQRVQKRGKSALFKGL